MKKSLLLVLTSVMMLPSCGTLSNFGPAADGYRFQDGIYASAPSFRSKEEQAKVQEESEALIEKTKGSMIYLFGDKKDSVYVPKEMAAKISFNNELGTTVTVSEYDWRYDNTWAWYSPYSIGSIWSWGAYDPWYFSPWRHNYGWHNPWHYSWYDPWYYGGYYDPWYYGGWYGGFYNPWYYGGWYGGFYGPHYAGWYGGWGPCWSGPYYGHHHGPSHHDTNVWRGQRYQTGADRVFASKGTSRSGMGRSSTTSRNSGINAGLVSTRSDSPSTGRISGTRSSATAVTSSNPARTTPVRTSSAVRNQNGTTSSKAASTTGTQASRGNYRRPAPTSSAATSPSSSYNRSSSSSSNRSSSSSSNRSSSSSSYNRSNSSSYNRSSSYSPGRSSGSYGGGSYGGGSRSSGGYSGGGASRSGGSSGARR